MSSISSVPRARKFNFWYALAIAAATLGTGGVSAWSTSHVDSSAVFLAAAAGLLGWIVWLLFGTARAMTGASAATETAVATGRRRKELEREKQSLLKALKELEFDHEMKKISDKDFREIGAQYRGRAVRVMRQLDEAGGEYRALIERELQARRASGKSAREAKPAAAGDAKEPSAPAPAVAGRPRCAACGVENDDDAEFCKKCGAKLRHAEAAP
jgi:hypothetical protein